MIRQVDCVLDNDLNENIYLATVCVKDCGLHNQNVDMIV